MTRVRISNIWERARRSFHYRIVFFPKMDKFYRYYQERKIKRIRKKDKIKVLFILGEASTWKTESLYQAMLSHPRFDPILGITESLFVPGSKPNLKKYLEEKGYKYFDLDNKGSSIRKMNPDIKFYYKPYEANYFYGLFFDHYLKSLTCSISYCFNLSAGPIAFKHSIRSYAWREFIENKTVLRTVEEAGKYIGNKAITGIPLQDILSQPKECFPDHWLLPSTKKRIIYAPHHSISSLNWRYIKYSTFLEFGEFMLEMAKKYSDRVQWIFKPHPSLINRLIKEWGKDKTESYYKEWESLENAQVKLGEYYSIFKHSDAMIHDCSSFIIEYMYADKPVLFLEKEPHTAEQMILSPFGYDAYLAHQHAYSKMDIENFILQIIEGGVDPKKEDRERYFNKYLSIPNGKTASENIINEILGTN